MPQLSLPSPSAYHSADSGEDSSSLNLLWLGAGALVLFGLIRKPTFGLALAAVTGFVAVRTTKANAVASDYTATANFLVNATPEQAYALWRNFERLPRFMSHLKSVRVLDAQRSEWTAVGPFGQDVTWQAEITHDVENQQISWASLPGSQVTNSGSVTFVPDAQGRGTSVIAQVRYTLPLGSASKALITLLGKNPEFVLREDVRRFKSLLEAGETPTTLGQSHGPRGVHGAVEKVLFRETSNRAQPQAAHAANDTELQSA